MTQEQVFSQVFEKYKDVLPGMKHGSGGLPDTSGPGTSDVDICIYSEDPTELKKYFPKNTEVDQSSSDRTIYKLKGYDRDVNIYCSNGEWWQNGYLHRQTELALRDQYPRLAKIAWRLKKSDKLSTEQAWAEVLGLGKDYQQELFNTEKILKIADQINKE